MEHRRFETWIGSMAKSWMYGKGVDGSMAWMAVWQSRGWQYGKAAWMGCIGWQTDQVVVRRKIGGLSREGSALVVMCARSNEGGDRGLIVDDRRGFQDQHW
jgi:hypothetical protein